MNLFLIQTQGRVAELNNQPLVICANKGDTITLSCTLAVNDSKNASKKWTLSWQSEGRTFAENVTNRWQNSSHFTSYLTLNAVWSGDLEKLFTCVASGLVNNTKTKLYIKATSLVKIKESDSCSIIGFRLLERPVIDVLELYWRPSESLENVKYSLNICTEPVWLLQNEVCPHYKRIHLNSSCFYRQRDVYKVPNTKGFTCMTKVKDLRLYDYQRAYISSRVQGDSCEHRCSAEKRFYLTIFRDPIPEPDYTEVVLIPAPVVKLRVITHAPRQVRLINALSN
jgi:hypothetical protein